MKKRVVIAGMGDTGLLVAIQLADQYEVIGISAKPCLVSGQELGSRLAKPLQWKKDYLMPFSRYKKLKNVKTVHGFITNISPADNTVCIKNSDGIIDTIAYDVLLISSGVSNGFWRNNHLQSFESIDQSIIEKAEQLSMARSIAIIGGGATGVSAASNLKEQYPDKDVHLFYSQQQPLPSYHKKVRHKVASLLNQQGVKLHPNHRAQIPKGFNDTDFSYETIEWQQDQKPFRADINLWAIGKVKPNNAFIPKTMLTEEGFVNANAYLQVQGFPNVFTVGDIADTDANRSSARNAGFLTAAANIDHFLSDKKQKMKRFKATQYRWGSIFGVQNNGMRIFTPKGGSILVNRYLVNKLLFPLFVRKLIYKGIEK